MWRTYLCVLLFDRCLTARHDFRDYSWSESSRNQFTYGARGKRTTSGDRTSSERAALRTAAFVRHRERAVVWRFRLTTRRCVSTSAKSLRKLQAKTTKFQTKSSRDRRRRDRCDTRRRDRSLREPPRAVTFSACVARTRRQLTAQPTNSLKKIATGSR
jgi:hypothetical protein